MRPIKQLAQDAALALNDLARAESGPDYPHKVNVAITRLAALLPEFAHAIDNIDKALAEMELKK